MQIAKMIFSNMYHGLVASYQVFRFPLHYQKTNLRRTDLFFYILK